MQYCEFKKEDKVVYIGSDWNDYPTYYNPDTRKSERPPFYLYDECVVKDFIAGTGVTYLILEGHPHWFNWMEFCYPNDKRLREIKLEKLRNNRI